MPEAGTPTNPLPPDTKVPEPKVVNATISAAGVIGALVWACQLLYGRADLIAFLPDAVEPLVLALVAAGATYGAGYVSRHQFRRRPDEVRPMGGTFGRTGLP